jgi:hypothetical protein
MATPSAYQRVGNVAITPSDYDTVGFPFYLRFDGDDWLQTNTITPGIDRVQVFAGVRKLSDAATGILAELGAGVSTGIFFVAAPRNNGLGDYSFRSTGTIAGESQTANTYPAPISHVFTGLGDISGDSAILRVNGVQAAINTADQGTGNFLSYPLYIGRRGGTSLPFNGHLYSLTVRFGPNLDAATINNMETYVNSKTKAY